MKNKERNIVLIIVALIGMYIASQAIADVAATRMIQIGKIVLPGGVLMFALTFTLRDFIHKRLGKKWARATVIMAAVMNVVQLAYLYFIGKLDTPVFYGFNEEWRNIFAIVPAVSIASIVAEVSSQLIDTEVYQFIMDKYPKLPQIFRVLISNFIALPFDSLIFALLGFVILPQLFGSTSYTFFDAIALTSGQIIYKAIVTILSAPAIYLIKDEPIKVSLMTE